MDFINRNKDEVYSENLILKIKKELDFSYEQTENFLDDFEREDEKFSSEDIKLEFKEEDFSFEQMEGSEFAEEEEDNSKTGSVDKQFELEETKFEQILLLNIKIEDQNTEDEEFFIKIDKIENDDLLKNELGVGQNIEEEILYEQLFLQVKEKDEPINDVRKLNNEFLRVKKRSNEILILNSKNADSEEVRQEGDFMNLSKKFKQNEIINKGNNCDSLFNNSVVSSDSTLPSQNRRNLKGCFDYNNNHHRPIFMSPKSGPIYNKIYNLARPVHRVRRNSKPYKCPLCEFSFCVKEDFTRHIESVHGKFKPFECTECNNYFSEKTKLVRHIELAHRPRLPELKIYRCPDCGYSCQNNVMHLIRHLRSVHLKLKT